MTHTDPNIQPPPNRVEVRGSNTTAWVVAALVALVAIFAVVFMTTSRSNETDPAEIARAVEQGRAEGMLAGAQSTIDSARDVSNAAAAQTAAEANRAAAEAQAAAAAASRSAEDAATNAADTLGPAPQPQTPQEPTQPQ